jgi:iron(III) transport system substrate-binding protein
MSIRFGRRGGTLALALILAGGIAPAACGSSSKPGSAATSITLYSGQHEQTTALLVSAFERQTGIHVNVRSDDEAVLANQLAQEGSSSPADVLYAENTPPLEFLREKGLLAKIDTTTLGQVDTKYNSPTGNWVGVSARVDVMVYNTKKLTKADLPHSMLDLATSAWKGKIGLSPGESDFTPIVQSVIKTQGNDRALQWLQDLKHNAGSHVYPDNEGLIDAINRGQVEVGVMNQYYWYRLRDEVGASKITSAVGFFDPHDPGYVLDVSGVAVLKSSGKQAAAQKLAAFLVSAAGERVLAKSESYEYPLGSGVKTAKDLPAFAGLQPIPLNLTDLGDGRQAVELLQQAQLL